MAARIICLIILLLEARALSLTDMGMGWRRFAFYTQLSNAAAAVSALALVVFGQTPATALLRYLGCCMLVMTFFVTSCILVPGGGNARELLFSGSGLYLHLIIPAVSVGSYLVLELHASSPAAIAVSTTLTFIYGMLMLYLNYRGAVDGPYPFFRVKDSPWWKTALYMAGLTLAIGLISLGVYALGK